MTKKMPKAKGNELMRISVPKGTKALLETIGSHCGVSSKNALQTAIWDSIKSRMKMNKVIERVGEDKILRQVVENSENQQTKDPVLTEDDIQRLIDAIREWRSPLD